MELTRYLFRLNSGTARMLEQVRAEMGLAAEEDEPVPADDGPAPPTMRAAPRRCG